MSECEGGEGGKGVKDGVWCVLVIEVAVRCADVSIARCESCNNFGTPLCQAVSRPQEDPWTQWEPVLKATSWPVAVVVSCAAIVACVGVASCGRWCNTFAKQKYRYQLSR